jgi:integrase
MADDTRHGERSGLFVLNLDKAPADDDTTLKQYADQWLEARVGLAVRTIELYEWLLNRYIEPELGTISLASLTPAVIRAWNSGHAKEHPTTAAKAYRLLSSILRTAVSDEILTRNPCQVRGAAVERAPERPIATMAEVDALAKAMPGPLRIAVLLAAWCQLRRGEVRGLRRGDIDIARGILSVNETRTNTMSGRTIVKAPKTRAGKRLVAIPPNILHLLSDHLREFVEDSEDALVIATTDRFLGLSWRRARVTANRPDLRFHDLRHSGLTWSAATGASLAELMRRAGHVSQAAALRYQHATDERDRILADALAGLANQPADSAIWP